ncbi:MAG: hypothetical protein ACFCUW_15180 [Kiloniellaceae bacterium]
MTPTFTLGLKADIARHAPRAAAHLHALNDHAAALRREALHLTDQQAEHRQEIAFGQTRLASLLDSLTGRRAAEELERQRMAPHQAEVARLAPLVERAHARFQAAIAVFTACMDFVDRRVERMRDHPLPAVEAPGGGWHQGVEDLRARLGAGADRRRAIERAPRDAGEAAAQVKTYVAELREKGRPNLRYVTRPGGSVADIRWPLTRTEMRRPSGGDPVPALSLDAPAILAWFWGDDFEAALLAEVEAQAAETGGKALTDAERERQLAELADETLEIERREEALIRAAAAEGIEIARRGDADPRAVLAIEFIGAAPALDLAGD